MNKTYSIAALRAWARPFDRADAAFRDRYVSPIHAESALEHGRAAVRAIRTTARDLRASELTLPNMTELASKRARLAFRAALTAVGIKGAL